MSQRQVSEEDRKRLSALNEEIISRISELRKIMSTYLDLKETQEIYFREKQIKSPEKGFCFGIEFAGGCYDDCHGTCYPAPCVLD